MRRLIAGLAGLGLIGGVGSVAYNHNGATVRIRGSNGQMQSVHVGFGKQRYNCPSGEDAKLNPLVIREGRIKLTMKSVEVELRRLKQKEPGAHASRQAIVRYNASVPRYNAAIRRARRLMSAFDATAHQYNRIIDSDCTAASGG